MNSDFYFILKALFILKMFTFLSWLFGSLENWLHKKARVNRVPCVLKTCSRTNVPCVLTCQRALRVYMLTCQRALYAYVPTCLACLRVHVQTCLTCLRAHVLTCQCALTGDVLTCQRGSFDATIFSFTAIVAEAVHTVGKVSEFNYCLSSVSWIHI